MASIPKRARQNLLDKHVRGLQAHANDARQHEDHCIRSRTRRLTDTGSPISLDGLNLLSHDSQSRQIASDLVQSVWRQGRSLWRDQRIELPGGFAEAGVEVPDSQPEPLGLHAVDDSSAFAHQALALAARPLGVLFLGHGDRPCCSVRTRRAASPETLSLAWPCRDGRSSNGDAYATPPRSSDGSRCLHTPSAQPTSQPKAYGADGSRA